MKIFIIAAAIVIAALIVGNSIQQASLPDVVKIAQSEQKAEQAILAQQKEELRVREASVMVDKFYSDVFERIPSSVYSELEGRDKLIFAAGFLFNGYFMTSLLAILGVIGAMFFCRSEQVPLKRLLKIRAIPIVMLTILFIGLMSMSISYSLGSFVMAMIAMSYKVIDPVISLGMLMIGSVTAGMIIIRGTAYSFDFLLERGFTVRGNSHD
ncbi:hypothetical protein OH460_08300 [Vibrio sp. Makdt]|uniref:hypothetical protein n=1 Tax=Vibrio sp. Makdt TaxID=2998828 RepID=UPI0022CDB11F|nr:hypothetical protein [Vibrio sp. Makdt]MDA0152300.1 hypothetical protein [Vibrio sp. Makdt]